VLQTLQNARMLYRFLSEQRAANLKLTLKNRQGNSKGLIMVKQKTRKELERRILELEAQTASTLKASIKAIDKVGEPLFASACIVHITALGGREVLPPFAVYDGLSTTTIESLKIDLQKTLDRITG
jgi:hypothetical protein